MSDIHTTLERIDAITWEPNEVWRAEIHQLVTEALDQLDDMERDHKAMWFLRERYGVDLVTAILGEKGEDA